MPDLAPKQIAGQYSPSRDSTVESEGERLSSGLLMVMSGSFKTNGDAGFSAGAKTEKRQKTAMTDDQMRVRFISSFQTGRSIIAGCRITDVFVLIVPTTWTAYVSD
jgi:hypothetical protein